MAEIDEGLALKEIREICDNAVEGLCPEGHFGLDKCPYPGGDDDKSMCGKCYMDLILAKATPIIDAKWQEKLEKERKHASNVVLAAVKQEKERITNELDACFKLAPNDNEYLKMLIEDTLAYVKTGLRRKERQALKEE